MCAGSCVWHFSKKIPEKFVDRDLFEQAYRLAPSRLEQFSEFTQFLDFVKDEEYVKALSDGFLNARLMRVVPERVITQKIANRLLAKKRNNYLYLPDRFVSKKYIANYIEKLNTAGEHDDYLDNYLRKRFNEFQIQPLNLKKEPEETWEISELDKVREAYWEKQKATIGFK